MHYSARLHELNTNGKLPDILCDFAFYDEASLWQTWLHWIGTSLGQLLLQSAQALGLLLSDVLVELLAGAVLHQQVHVLIVLEEMVQLDDVCTLQLPVHLYLLSDARRQVLRPKVLFIYDFKCVYVTRLAASYLVNESRRAPTQLPHDLIFRQHRPILAPLWLSLLLLLLHLI